MKKDFGPEIAKSILRAATQTFSKLLLDAGESNPVVEGDYTALTYSAQYGNYQSIAVLAARHVDMNAEDAAGRNALELAYRRRWTGAFDALMQGGYDPTVTTSHGFNMLERVATTGDGDWGQRLTKHIQGAALDTRDAEGNTPLMLSLKHVRHGVSLAYIQAGADVFAVNNHGQSVRDFAELYPFKPILDLITKAEEDSLASNFNAQVKKQPIEFSVKPAKTRSRKAGAGESVAKPARSERKQP